MDFSGIRRDMFSKSHWTLQELAFISVFSVLLGGVFWGWTFVHSLAKPLLQLIGLNYLLAGPWIIPSLLPPFIIRKRGAAFLASVITAFVEGLLSKWGLMALLWGAVQGLAAEVIFALWGKRPSTLALLVFSALGVTLASYMLDSFYYQYHLLPLDFRLRQLGSFILSSELLGAYLSFWLVQKLKKTGLLDTFASVHDFSR